MALVSHQEDGEVFTITLDDGKVNALSPEMLAEIRGALDLAERHEGVVVLRGRAGVLSAGFSLPVLQAGGPEAARMLAGGFELAQRVLTFPAPVVIACTGHAIAMGSFLLLTGDYRIAVGGPYKIMANEVAIGLPVPYAAVEICRFRLNPGHFHRAVALAEAYAPDGALAAGFVDAVVDPAELDDAVATAARSFAGLNRAAHTSTKLRVRAAALSAVAEGLEKDGFRSPLKD